MVQQQRAPERWAASRQCLDDARGELSAWLHAMSHDADIRSLPGAVVGATELARVETCADDTWLARHPERADVDPAWRAAMWRAKALRFVGRYDEALEVTDRLLVEVGDQNLEVRAATLAQAGVISAFAGRSDDAEQYFLEAFDVAMRAGDDDTALTAASELVSVIDDAEQREEDALWWARIAQGLLRRVGGIDGHHDAALHSKLGVIHWRRKRFDEAQREQQRALEIAEALVGPKHPDVASIRVHLGVLAKAKGDLDEAQRQYRLALEIYERVLGPAHPDVALTINDLGMLELARGSRARAGVDPARTSVSANQDP
jgi:tetratricopeptide (TPR) repeat protein